jgi:hypothetical protein
MLIPRQDHRDRGFLFSLSMGWLGGLHGYWSWVDVNAWIWAFCTIATA